VLQNRLAPGFPGLRQGYGTQDCRDRRCILPAAATGFENVQDRSQNAVLVVLEMKRIGSHDPI
jgi:hypothetical protein